MGWVDPYDFDGTLGDGCCRRVEAVGWTLGVEESGSESDGASRFERDGRFPTSSMGLYG